MSSVSYLIIMRVHRSSQAGQTGREDRLTPLVCSLKLLLLDIAHKLSSSTVHPLWSQNLPLPICIFILFSASSSVSPYDGAVRLVDGGTGFLSSGIAEVYLHDQWGTMCSNQVFVSEASTICRQLGYTSSTTHSSIQRRYITWRTYYDVKSAP